MTDNKPKLSRRPGSGPVSIESAAEKLARLDKAQDWTEQAENSPAENDLPWAHANDKVEKKVLLRLPESLHAKLKYLGDTTYGESMNSIIIKALKIEAERRLTERGLI